jgi:hypothetical protein
MLSRFGRADLTHPSPPPGLCGTCHHVRVVTSSRASTFHLCGRAAEDARFAKYPRLPVVWCEGYAVDSDGPGDRPRKLPIG